MRAKTKTTRTFVFTVNYAKAKKTKYNANLEVLPTQQTTKTPEPVVSMDVDPSPSKKGKEKETLDETPEKTTTTIDVNATQPYVLARSIKVTEIPLDSTEHRIKMKFTRFGTIIRFTIETKNMWQQATITFAEDANFMELKNCYGLFVLNDIVRVYMCDQFHVEILAHSKFPAKLAGLSRFTTGR
ncbi:10066_t:CDS:2 [Funneliformis geosporum]|nr:10066_t:CDS:2 [Funneliformis geosporum]